MRRRTICQPALALALSVAASFGCASAHTGAGPQPAAVVVAADPVPFGTLPDGRAVHAFTLTNRHGVSVRVLDYGATISSLRVPDRTGAVEEVVLGFDSLAPYVRAPRYFGVVVGRYGNRIANGAFEIDGRRYQLARNNGPNHLHGGVRGFDKVLWQARPFRTGDSAGVALAYTSADGEEGYPGNLQVTVTYTLTSDDRLAIDYRASTDAPTPVNLTNHSFFNLAGARRDVLDHVLTIHASAYTPVDRTLIPTGEIAPVAGTPFDFRVPARIGARIEEQFPQLRQSNGYDHNFVLDRSGAELAHAAHVLEPESGRTLDIYTTEPGLQFFSGNSLNGSAVGTGGRAFQRRYGFCLETQHFPDSPNRPQFPSTLLRPGTEYRSRTVWAFGVSR